MATNTRPHHWEKQINWEIQIRLKGTTINQMKLPREESRSFKGSAAPHASQSGVQEYQQLPEDLASVCIDK